MNPAAPPPPGGAETVGISAPETELEPPVRPGHSAASMATEILSAAPRTPTSEPTENAPTLMAEDVTIMAKGRRRRFRLR